MKAFVCQSIDYRWDPVTIAVAMGLMMLAAETLGDLPICRYAHTCASEAAKIPAGGDAESKALLGAGRSTGSR